MRHPNLIDNLSRRLVLRIFTRHGSHLGNNYLKTAHTLSSETFEQRLFHFYLIIALSIIYSDVDSSFIELFNYRNPPSLFTIAQFMTLNLKSAGVVSITLDNLSQIVCWKQEIPCRLKHLIQYLYSTQLPVPVGREYCSTALVHCHTHIRSANAQGDNLESSIFAAPQHLIFCKTMCINQLRLLLPLATQLVHSVT